MIANIAAQPTWTTTYEVPLPSDLHWAIAARLHARRDQYRTWKIVATVIVAITGTTLLALSALSFLLTMLLSPGAWSMLTRMLEALATVGAAIVATVLAWPFFYLPDLSSLEQDLAGGVVLETVSDVELKPGLGRQLPERVILNDRVFSEGYAFDRNAIATLRALGTIHGATVRYSPKARMLLEIVTADGVLVYRPPELLRAK